MTTVTQKPAQAAVDDEQRIPDYTAEIRFGVVMYGGVSLAIYINGVANELYEMACATPRDGVRIDDPSAGFTREIYCRVSWLAGNSELRARYAQAIRAANAAVEGTDRLADDVWAKVDRRDATQTRFAIDVIAGTSAGGINGVFLAKALANGEKFAALKDLWVNEGDIALLLNDENSYADTRPKIANRSAKPTSLLNSDRMYVKLQYAMQQMAPLGQVRGLLTPGDSPLVEEIDLYVTTTDIRGSAVPLRLFDNVVYERRYKQNFHLSFPNGDTLGGNDFAAVNTPFLAFASRCTSSFPFAFEPMMLNTLTRLRVDGDAPGVLRWNGFFPNLPRDEVSAGRHVYRAFGDGGYLDNKPFSYVVETLSRRFAAVPMERKLLFVEPSPENLHPDDPDMTPDERDTPDAVENSLAALTSIPRYETIREDLQNVLARNRRIERIERVVMLGERSIDDHLNDPLIGVIAREGKVPVWSTLTLSDMVRYYGAAFLPYQRLRVYSVTDTLANGLAARWSIDAESDQVYALRALVRVWRDRQYDEEGRNGRQTFNAFLDQFDFDYRIRRLGFLLRKVDKMTRLFHRRAAGELLRGPVQDGMPPPLSEEELQLLDVLPALFGGLAPDVPIEVVRDGERVLRTLKSGLLECRERLLDAHRTPDNIADGEEGLALRKDLQTILAQILGDVAPGESTTVRAKDNAGLTRVILRPEALRMASASRTLQDAVLFRARALFDASERVAATPIQDHLIADVEAMRVKRPSFAPGDARHIEAAEPELHVAVTLAWRLLGAPELIVDQESKQVVVQVGDARSDGLARVGPRSLDLLNTNAGCALRLLLGKYLLRFDSYDQMSFPLYYDTGTGEPSTVEVVRVSPVDATNLIDETNDPQRRHKLAGTALANFGAFLDRRWRLNDIMWGRLDGVERLVQVLLPMTDDDTRDVRKELIERAQRSVLKEALMPAGHATLTDLVAKALDATPSSGTTTEQLRDMLGTLWTGDTVARDRLGGLLVSLLSETGLMNYVRNSRKVDAEPDPQATLKSAARAVTITGRVLESISKKHDAGKAVTRWIARLGLMLQGIVAVSLPGTLNQRWWTHGVKVLYAFEAVLVVLAFVFGNADMRTLAITALASTFGVHLLTLMTGDLMREKQHRIVHGAVMCVLGALIALALVGSLVLVHQGAQQQLCWTKPGGDGPDGGLASSLCQDIGDAHAWWSDHFKASKSP